MKNLIARQFRFLAVLAAIACVTGPVEAASATMRAASERLIEKAGQASDQDKARKLLEQALVADPSNTKAISGLGEHYVVAGKPAVARKYFNNALMVDPSDVRALSGLAQLDLADGKRSAAEERYIILKTVCATCSETRALGAKLNAMPNASPTDKPSPMDKQ
ncbi:MAG: hypothetical protein Q7T44_09750 [Parvibaculum sp.]|nr:hypothetical protein [Parvibaculum sp.]